MYRESLDSRDSRHQAKLELYTFKATFRLDIYMPGLPNKKVTIGYLEIEVNSKF